MVSTSKHNSTKRAAWYVFWLASQRPLVFTNEGLWPGQIAGVLEDVTTRDSLYTLFGRWRRWGYIGRVMEAISDSDGGGKFSTGRYYLKAKGLKWLVRHQAEINKDALNKRFADYFTVHKAAPDIRPFRRAQILNIQ